MLACVVTTLPDRIDYIRAGLPTANEGRDQLGRVLQIGVHRHDDVAFGRLKAGRKRRLLAKVAGQLQDTIRPIRISRLISFAPILSTVCLTHA